MIDIKDTSNLIRFSTPINEGSKRKYTLMKEDYVSFKFSVPNPIYFKLGDYVDDAFGLFEVVDLQKPTYNESTGAYDYELRLDAYYWKWKNKRFFYSPQIGGSEASWNLTASLKAHTDVFLRNLATLGYTYKGAGFSVIIDSTVVDSAKLVQYDNTSLIDALSQMAQEWECEWWIIGSVIRFGRCQNSGEPVNFEMEANVTSMTRSDSKTSYATRIYAFGSTRNIPSSYRKDLIFDVKEVKGCDIKDTVRKLEIQFFPENSRIEAPKIPTVLIHMPGQAYFTAHPATYSKVWALADSMPAGTYRIVPKRLELGALKGGAGNSIYDLKGTLSLIYSVGGSDKSIVLQSKKGISNGDGNPYYAANFTECTFLIEKNASNFRLSIDASVEFNGADANVEFSVNCDATVQNVAAGANVPLTFLSGSNTGKTFNAVYNPDFLLADAANVIRLPEGVTASVGDTYTIDNIIKSKVPVIHFSKSNTELTVEGVVTTRLMLPAGTNCVNAYENMTQEEAIEDIVIFEDVYPRRVGTMVEVTDHEHKEEIKEDGKETVTETWKAYRFKDAGFKSGEFIFSEGYVLPDQELRIKFESGILNGMSFAVKFNPFEKGETQQPEKNADGTWNEKAQVFEIKRDEDSVLKLPGGAMTPRGKEWNLDGTVAYEGDKYVLEGFDTEFVLNTMIPAAEKELKEKAQEYVEKSKIDPSVYDCKMNPVYIHNNGVLKTFNLGDRVNLINKTYFDTGRESRIIGYEYPLDIPYDKPIYTVGETAAYSRLGALEEKVESLTYKGQTYNGSGGSSSGGNSVYVIGKNDNTPPTDSNVFSAIRVLEELLSNNEELKKLFLSKTSPDQTDFLLKLFGGAIIKQGLTADRIEVGENVIDSLLAGKGIIADSNGRIQADRMELRSSLTVLRLIINDLQAMSGDYSFSDCGCIEKVAQINDNTYKLWMEKRTDTDWTNLDENDVMMSIVNSLLIGGTAYYTSWFRCVAKNRNDNTLTIVLYPDSEVPGGKNYPPAEGYNVTRRGNVMIPDIGNTNERAQSWMISSREGRIMFLQNVFKPILEDYNYALSIGRFPKIDAIKHLPIGENDMGILAKTIVCENLYRYDYNGNIIASEVFRGEWSAAVASGNAPYRFVTHKTETSNGSKLNELEQHTVYLHGCKWGCLVDKTTEEPKWNSSAWVFLEGNNNYSISFASTAGFQFFYGAVNTTVVASVLFGSRDITAELLATPGADVQWTRNTENVPDDNAWHPTFDGAKNCLKLTQKDMGRDWLIRRKTIFICTVFIPSGEGFRTKSEKIGFNL